MRRLGPYVVAEKPGRVAWCACGESAKDPYCDGSHARLKTGVMPLVVDVPKAGTVAWCGCKRARSAPYCNGSHARLRMEAEEGPGGRDASLHERTARKNERLLGLMGENAGTWPESP